jgi:hypothetical protein
MTGSSYGSVSHEAQYIVNYTYMIGLLLLFYYGYKNYNLSKLPKISFITLSIYVGLIYLSIITNTSSCTYIEGIGYKGWFASGNAIGSILLLLFCIALPFVQKEKKKLFGLFVFFLLAIFLMVLVGTRVGLFGYILCIVVFVLANLFIKFIKKLDLKKAKTDFLILGVVIILGVVVFLIGSNTFERKQFLNDIGGKIIDPKTGEVSHVTGDALKIIDSIHNNTIEANYMSDAEKQSMLDLYDYANKHELNLTNRRSLQLVYNVYLVKNQHDYRSVLVGNGYLNSYYEMILEMEAPAILLNFGIIGFILYLMPFIMIDLWAIKTFFMKLKSVDVEFIMYLATAILAFALSFFAGYTFFNVSSMAIIVTIHILLIKKAKEC